MKRILKLIAATSLLVMAACASSGGARIGVGIGGVSGSTSSGTFISGSIGATINVFD